MTLKNITDNFYHSVNDLFWNVGVVFDFYYSIDKLGWKIGFVEQEEDNTKLIGAIENLFKVFDDSTQWVSSAENFKLFSEFYSSIRKVLKDLCNDNRSSLSQEVDLNVVQCIDSYLNTFS